MNQSVPMSSAITKIFLILLLFNATALADGVMGTRSLILADVDTDKFIGSNVLTDPDARQAFLEFCKAPHGNRKNAIRTVYFSTGWHGFGRVSTDDNELKNFIRQVHQAGIKIFNIQGYHGWVLTGKDQDGIRVIKQILDYNKAAQPDERFDGILLDIEPYIMTFKDGHGMDWKKQPQTVWRNYIRVLDRIARRVKRHNRKADTPLLLGECIPTFYPPQGRPGHANFKEVMDRVDFTWLRCYHDNPATIYDEANDEIQYAEQINKPIVLGLCVNPPDPKAKLHKNNTFWDQGYEHLEKSIKNTRTRFIEDFNLQEVAFFAYQGYKQLKPNTQTDTTNNPKDNPGS